MSVCPLGLADLVAAHTANIMHPRRMSDAVDAARLTCRGWSRRSSDCLLGLADVVAAHAANMMHARSRSYVVYAARLTCRAWSGRMSVCPLGLADLVARRASSILGPMPAQPQSQHQHTTLLNCLSFDQNARPGAPAACWARCPHSDSHQISMLHSLQNSSVVWNLIRLGCQARQQHVGPDACAGTCELDALCYVVTLFVVWCLHSGICQRLAPHTKHFKSPRC
jgi:hypothetical protein